MNEFMKIVLSLSVSGTLLLLLILGLKLLYKNKFSRRWQYYIWIIAALRFLLPFTPDTTIVGSLFEKFDTAVITNEIPTSPQIPITTNTSDRKKGSDADPTQEKVQQTKAEQTQEETQAYENVITDTAVNNSPDRYACLFFIWAALALVLFVRKITIYQGFIRYIKAGNSEVSDIKTLNLLSDCTEKLNIKTRVELYHNALIASPMMTGFFRPSIVLPAGELGDRELSYIFLHELTHYRQRDMFYKWLIQIVVCVHWFNPFVYLLEREVNKACELSCDEKVISVLDDKARRAYGDTLISFLKSDNPCKNSFASVTLTEGAEQIKERLGAIMKFKKKSKTVMVVTAIFTIAVCFCFFATGAYAAPATAMWKDSEILNNVLTEDGVYYIFCDGAGENDKPLSSVSAGSIQFVLVRKDSYTSIGPFNNKKTLVGDVTKQCEYMKNLTKEEKKLVIETAAGILKNAESDTKITNDLKDKSEDSYFTEYRQQGITATGGAYYYQGERVRILMDLRTDHSFENFIFDNEGSINLRVLRDKNHSITTVEYLTTSEADEMLYDMDVFPAQKETKPHDKLFSSEAERYYEAGSLPLFQIVFSRLNEEEQRAWMDRIYADRDVSFFSVCVGELYTDSPLIGAFAEKCYQDNEIAFFSVLTGSMSEEMLKKMLDRALEDKKTSFQVMLFNELGMEEELDAFEKKQAEDQLKKYQAVGVTKNGKNYYYQGKLVNIFLDHRPNSSYYTLSANPQGAVNIKIVYNANGEITGVSYMTDTEIERFFGAKEEIPLVNTCEWDSSAISAIEASYNTDSVSVLPSPTDKIILKEYLTQNQSGYYAGTEIKNNVLIIRSDDRPATNYKSYIEIYVPNAALDHVRVETVSGAIEVCDYAGILELSTTSGAIDVSDSNIAGNIDTVSGRIELSLVGLSGDLYAHATDGEIFVDLPDTISYNLKAKTTSGKIYPAAQSGIEKEFSGVIGNNPKFTITLTTTSANIEIN